MSVFEHVPLAPLTTLGVGGEARFLVEASSENDVLEARLFADTCALPLFVLGEGSNLLVPDEGIEGVVVRVAMRDTTAHDQGESVVLSAGAGALWEDIVKEAQTRKLFGIENLAGIPGSLGGAVVQNIGAYGAELSRVFEYADTTNRTTGVSRRFTPSDASFAYRSSYFKEHPEHIITRVAVRLKKRAAPNLSYPDLARAQAEGVALTTPMEIAHAVRRIRARKFPERSLGGTAGSFFKNPLLSAEKTEVLKGRFPDIPTFPQADTRVKIPLAWVLDHVLALKGFRKGRVRLYENQPLVIVTSAGASAREVDAFATDIAERVYEATGIRIEREVETFGKR